MFTVFQTSGNDLSLKVVREFSFVKYQGGCLRKLRKSCCCSGSSTSGDDDEPVVKLRPKIGPPCGFVHHTSYAGAFRNGDGSFIDKSPDETPPPTEDPQLQP